MLQPSCRRPRSAARAIDAVKVYGEGDVAVRALDDVYVDIPQGVFTAVMGPSGSGKSTLVHCLAGLDTLTSGEIEVGGQRLSGMSEKQLTILRRDRIGFVFQSFNLIPTLTARREHHAPADLAGRHLDPAWLDTVIDAVGLRDRLKHRPGELSGGQQQRVAVARVPRRPPRDRLRRRAHRQPRQPAGRRGLGFLRRAVDEFGQTVVMVTHDPVAAAATATASSSSPTAASPTRCCDPTTERVLDRMKRFGD